MRLRDHARVELQAAGLFGQDSDYGGMLGDAVMELVATFAGQGHSGFSASMTLKAFDRVARFEPLVPLSGNDDEWAEVSEQDGKPLYQNKRCGRVFKCGDRAYDIEGKVFREPNGSAYTSSDSCVDVTFPYTPTTEYVDAPEESDE